MRSIRFRLALWYAAALSLGLLAFAAVVWLSAWRSLSNDVQHALDEQVRNIHIFLRDELKDPRLRLPEELGEYAQALPESVLMKVTADDGSLLFNSQPRFPWNGTGEWRGHSFRIVQLTVSAGRRSWQVSFAHSLARMHEILNRLFWLLLALLPAVVLVAACGGIWLSRQAMRPVDEMTAAAREIGIGDLSRRLAVPQTGDELQRLSETWNQMLARLENAVTRLTRFTSDAAHELRTPVAVIRSTAEIAARRSRPEEAYRSALNTVVLESERMTALIDDLLFLARCDSHELQLDMSSLSLADVGDDVNLSMHALAESRGIRLQVSVPADLPPVRANRAAIRRLLLILVDNAIKYSRPGGSVEIRAGLNLGEVTLHVADSGFGIPPAELPFVFQRFYRGTAAREGGANGFGLGLALASGIARQHHSRLEVSSSTPEGSVFALAFPVNSSL